MTRLLCVLIMTLSAMELIGIYGRSVLYTILFRQADMLLIIRKVEILDYLALRKRNSSFVEHVLIGNRRQKCV